MEDFRLSNLEEKGKYGATGYLKKRDEIGEIFEAFIHKELEKPKVDREIKREIRKFLKKKIYPEIEEKVQKEIKRRVGELKKDKIKSGPTTKPLERIWKDEDDERWESY